jgi:hypothetical protein
MKLFSMIMSFRKKNRKIFSLIVLLFVASFVFLNVFQLSSEQRANPVLDYVKKHTKSVKPVEVDEPKNDPPADMLQENLTDIKQEPVKVEKKIILEAIKKKVRAPNGKKDRIYASDRSGIDGNSALVDCGSDLEVQLTSDTSVSNFSVYLNGVTANDLDKYLANNHRHYHMVFAMESEPHSGGGESWKNADFRMWYNLNLSFPEPATYFDIKLYMPDLLAPPRVDFDKKVTSAPLVWILSNCNAFNSREKFVQNLMSLIKVDSFGGCLNNNRARGAGRMTGNDDVFADYKFVITIENSNCVDYVTEKLVYAVKSGSIPIVAGKNNKPNYARYLPKNSYINVYDFKTVADLVKHLKLVASNRTEYEKYFKFKFKHNYTREFLISQPLSKQIEIAKSILGEDEEKEFFNGIILKEKSQNKVCKIARYINETPRETVEAEIKSHRIARPSISEACLPSGDLSNIPKE